MKPGICSVTCRQLGLQGVVDLTRLAGLDAIEWGGDVHVPPGDMAIAKEARRLTIDAGLEVSSYGSYYTVLDTEGNAKDFSPVLESALALGTDTIRIWPGARPSEVAGADYRVKLIEKLRADLDLAAARNVRLALEFHANTLSDSNAAASALLEEMNHPNLYSYWQPMYWLAEPAYRFQGLEKLAERVLNLHVFHWRFCPFAGTWNENIDRRPLSEGADEWRRLLSVPLPAGDHYALLEFVRGDEPEQFVQDAATLKQWLFDSASL